MSSPASVIERELARAGMRGNQSPADASRAQVAIKIEHALDEAGHLDSERLGTSEVADMLGTTTSNVTGERFPGLPEPVQVLRGGRLWSAKAIRDFIARPKLAVVPEPPSCAVHGTEDMRVPASGRAYCAVCNRERARRRTAAERKAERMRAKEAKVRAAKKKAKAR